LLTGGPALADALNPTIFDIWLFAVELVTGRPPTPGGNSIEALL
jgi:hypothetical protein